MTLFALRLLLGRLPFDQQREDSQAKVHDQFEQESLYCAVYPIFRGELSCFSPLYVLILMINLPFVA